MTWRELIVYVLQNNLEDKPVFENGKISGFMTISEAATNFEVGEETIKVWLNREYLNYIEIGDMKLIPITGTLKLESRRK